MIKMKYVIVEKYGCEYPIMFSAGLSHDSFSQLHPVSAGFVSFSEQDNHIVVYCHGESQSLNLKSRTEEDSRLVVREMNRSAGFGSNPFKCE